MDISCDSDFFGNMVDDIQVFLWVPELLEAFIFIGNFHIRMFTHVKLGQNEFQMQSDWVVHIPIFLQRIIKFVIGYGSLTGWQ